LDKVAFIITYIVGANLHLIAKFEKFSPSSFQG